MRLTRKITALLLALVLVLGMTACATPKADTTAKDSSSNTSTDANNGTANPDAASDAAKERTSLIASGQPYSHTLPAWLGERDGLFEAANMDFEILMFTGGAAQNEALGADEWAVGTMGSPPSITGGIAYGVKVIGFGSPDTEAVTIWARSDSDVAQVSGAVDGYPEILGDADTWRGKTILCPTSTSAHFTLIATLKALGLTSDDVEIIDMGVAQGYTAFKAGEADIVCLWDPQGFYAEDEGWTCISSGKATGEAMPTVIVASEKAIAEQHDEILEYLDIYFQESEKYANDLDAYAQAMLDIGLENGIEQDYDTAYKCAAKRPLQTLDDEIEWFSGEYGSRKADIAMENLMDFFVYTGTIEESDKQTLIDNGFVDGSFIEELAARYGKTLN